MVKSQKIFDPDADAVHSAWRKALKRCKLKYGDIDPMTSVRFDDLVERYGMTPREIEQFAIHYYKSMGWCKKEGKTKTIQNCRTSYRILQSARIDGIPYMEGSIVCFSDKIAKPFLKKGSIKVYKKR